MLTIPGAQFRRLAELGYLERVDVTWATGAPRELGFEWHVVQRARMPFAIYVGSRDG
jgi:hypothetical protein